MRLKTASVALGPLPSPTHLFVLCGKVLLAFSSSSGCGDLQQGNVRVNTWLRSRMLAFGSSCCCGDYRSYLGARTWPSGRVFFFSFAFCNAGLDDGCCWLPRHSRESPQRCFVVARQCDRCRGSHKPAEASAPQLVPHRGRRRRPGLVGVPARKWAALF